MKAFLLLLHFLLPLCHYAQLNENFSDGNFSANPPWTGTTADWTVAAGKLQSNNTVANSSFYLSTPNTMATITQWDWYLRLNFNTSSANYVDIYLMASSSDLTLPATTGYFVRVGNTQDDICLYRKDASGATTKLIDGIDGLTNTSDNTLKIRVTRSAANEFTLYRDASGSGNNYVPEGTATDATYTSSSWFGIFVKQSTSSFFQKHFFDDIVIQSYAPDITPPSIQSINLTSPASLDLLFSEAVEISSSQTVGAYLVNNGIGMPLTATRDVADPSLVHLVFNNSFSNGINYMLTVNGVKDLAGNSLSNATGSFSFQSTQLQDVIIGEIMADPNPAIALPNIEFVELRNRSGKTIDLTGWKLMTASSTSGAFPSCTLPADSFLLLTSTANAAAMSAYGRAIGIGSFPALPNEGSLLALISKEGKTIHAIEYDVEWYGNEVKKDGGWTLEMIDTQNPCGGSENWKASIDPTGGTPGRKNSVAALNPDHRLPRLLRSYTTDSITVVALFNETLDSTSAAIPSHYTIQGNAVISAQPQPPLFREIVLRLSAPLLKATVYELSTVGLKDCAGNAMTTPDQCKLGLSEEPEALDLVVNEILFNPRPNAFDYVEIYNRSGKIIDAARLYVGNRNNGTIGSLKKLSDKPFFIYHGEYIVATENLASLQTNYLVQWPEKVLILSSLASFPDDKGDVVLTNLAGTVIDEVAYTDDWHFALISNDEGVALERIDPAASSQNKDNWHSAAGTAGYGTPTYRNSQYKQAGQPGATITIDPKLFSPDNDGNDDFATITYKLSEPGYVANVIIFDAAGQRVRYLVKNDLMGISGSWRWDGLNDKKQKLPKGIYIIYTEIFNLKGKRERFKGTVVLGRKV